MAEQSVVADLDGIKAQIKDLSKSARDAANNSRRLGQELQFDPNNLRTLVSRFQSLQTELKKNKQLVQDYEEAIKKFSEVRDALGQKENPTDDEAKRYEDARNTIRTYEEELEKTRRTIQYLEAATAEHAVSLKVQRTALAQARERFEPYQKAVNVAAGLITALTAATVRLVKSSIELGSELYNLSIRYDTSVESIQVWNRALQFATGQTDLFTNSVNTMIKGISQITSGRGVAYQNALRNIGLSYKDLEDKSTAERFEEIVRALGEVAEESERVSYAQQLLGESGQSIAGMFEREGFALDEYLARAREYGTLTEENAEKLAEMSFEVEYARSQWQLATATLTTSLAPALELVVGWLNGFSQIAKGLSSLFNGLGKGGQAFVLTLVTMTAIAPIAIKMLTSISANMAILRATTDAGTHAVKGLTRALSGVQVALGAIGVVATIVLPIIGAIVGAVNDANNAAENFAGVANDYAAVGEDYGGIIEQRATASSTSTVQMDVTITGQGDTRVSDEAAQNIAQLTADELNKRLGELIK